VRENGGNAVALSFVFKHIAGIGKGQHFFAGSDIGWVVGHSFIAYGPLLAGASTLGFEGKPVGTPDAGTYWRIIEKHKIDGLFTSPTAIRSIRKEDNNGDFVKRYDISSLKTIMMAGERCDPATHKWLQDQVPKNVLINDNYWQTESGWPILCNFSNLHTFPTKPGSAVKPAPGYELELMDEDHNPIKTHGTVGKLFIKLPLPPSFMTTLHNNAEGFIDKYLRRVPG